MKKIIEVMINVVMLICIALTSTSCSSDEDARPSRTFVLIAGSWQGAWVWKDVKFQLEKAGQKVIIVELPAHGKDNTPPQNVSMDIYRDKAIEVINTTPGKVVLVGHSMAGVVISAVSEKIPTKIEKLIYLGAILPANGQSLLDLASTDTEALLGPSIIPLEDQLLLDVIHDKIIEIFCQDGTPQVKQALLDNFKLEPAIPFADKVTLSAERFGKVPKTFIHTELDHAIGLKLQKRMVGSRGHNEYLHIAQ